MNTLLDLFQQFVEVYARALRVYGEAFRRRPLFLFLLILAYVAVLFMVPAVRYGVSDYWDRVTGRDVLQLRVVQLQLVIDQQQKVMEVLVSQRERVALFGDLSFDESWETAKHEESVLRLMDYAVFAMDREDYAYALEFLSEASGIQNTLAVPYLTGRIRYSQGNLAATVDEWTEVIRLDPDNRYPVVRLYLGIVLHQMGDTAESNRLLQEFLDPQGS